VAREGKVVAWRAPMRRASGTAFWGEHHATFDGRSLIVGMLEEVNAPADANVRSDLTDFPDPAAEGVTASWSRR
jgi:hypothetical protein